MKALSVTQPWASVICSGVKDVENRNWKPATAPGKILIHATQAKVPSYFESVADEFNSIVKNERLMGHIPDYKDMPYGSIIGYVDCYQIVQDSDSYWAQPDSYHWCLRDAHLFDEPIPDIKGVRGRLFDVDIDEDNLPLAHKVEIVEPRREGTRLILPVNAKYFNNVKNGDKEVWFELTIMNDWLYFDEKGNELETESIELICQGEHLVKDVDMIVYDNYTDGEGKPVNCRSVDGSEIPWMFVAIVLK